MKKTVKTPNWSYIRKDSQIPIYRAFQEFDLAPEWLTNKKEDTELRVSSFFRWYPVPQSARRTY